VQGGFGCRRVVAPVGKAGDIRLAFVARQGDVAGGVVGNNSHGGNAGETGGFAQGHAQAVLPFVDHQSEAVEVDAVLTEQAGTDPLPDIGNTGEVRFAQGEDEIHMFQGAVVDADVDRAAQVEQDEIEGALEGGQQPGHEIEAGFPDHALVQ